MNKKNKIIYWVATGLLTGLMLMSAGMYFFNYEMVSEIFVTLGYPTYIIYPLAIAKILGLITIWWGKSRMLKEWAYAGFFFDLVLALAAHLHINDGDFGGAVIGIVLLMLSYIYNRKLYGNVALGEGN